MALDTWSELLTLAFSGIALPLIAWVARGAYDSWHRDDVYISTIRATGQAPGLLFGTADEAVAVSWGIRVRVVNVSDRLLALEKIHVHFRWRSTAMPQLRHLIDECADVVVLKDRYEGLGEDRLPNELPVLLRPKGGTVFLEIRAAMRFRGNGWWRFAKPLTYHVRSIGFSSPDQVADHEKAVNAFIHSLRPGGEWLNARISGKVRSYPIKLQ